MGPVNILKSEERHGHEECSSHDFWGCPIAHTDHGSTYLNTDFSFFYFSFCYFTLLDKMIEFNELEYFCVYLLINSYYYLKAQIYTNCHHFVLFSFLLSFALPSDSYTNVSFTSQPFITVVF